MLVASRMPAPVPIEPFMDFVVVHIIRDKATGVDTRKERFVRTAVTHLAPRSSETSPMAGCPGQDVAAVETSSDGRIAT